MSYYITAHRNGSKINMPVEEKHKYITDTVVPDDDGSQKGIGWIGSSEMLNSTNNYTNVICVRGTNYKSHIDATGHSSTGYDHIAGLNSVANDAMLFFRPQKLNIPQGNGAQQRIGDKVFMKSVKICMDIKLNRNFWNGLNGTNTEFASTVETYKPVEIRTTEIPTSTGDFGTWPVTTTTKSNTITTFKNERNCYKQWAKCRVMIVRFTDWVDDGTSSAELSLKNYISEWFNTIFVPQFIVPNTGHSSPFHEIIAVSNQSKMLRESTKYNGQYKILYDNLVTLGNLDEAKHLEIVLNPKKNLNFDSAGYVTNDDWNNVFGFIIPPTLYQMDMDEISSYNMTYQNENYQFPIADFVTNTKYTYYDL